MSHITMSSGSMIARASNSYSRPLTKKWLGSEGTRMLACPRAAVSAGRQAQVGEHAVRRRHLALYVFEICVHFELLLLLRFLLLYPITVPIWI